MADIIRFSAAASSPEHGTTGGRCEAGAPFHLLHRPVVIDLHQSFAESVQREEYRPTLRDDWREFWSEVADAPAHHALFAVLVIVGWTVLLVAPLWLGLLS